MTAINSNRAIRGPVTAVPVVAGKGVRLVADTVNNRWVVEADETELWSTANGSSTGNLSEAATNFEKLRIYWTYNNSGTTQGRTIIEIPIYSDVTRYFLNVTFGQTYCYLMSVRVDFSNNFGTFTAQNAAGVQITQWGGAGTVSSVASENINPAKNGIYRIVGINRIASA
jgi:hypothetical protein